MQRRKFLSLAALLLLGQNALAAPRKSSSRAAAGKAAGKGKRKRGKAASSQPAQRLPQNTADRPVIDVPPPGSSATRLPRVKAPGLPELWRDFEVTTELSLRTSASHARKIWLPLPLPENNLYQRHLGYEWEGDAENLRTLRLSDGEQEVLCASWSAGRPNNLKLIQRVSIAERNFDVTRRSFAPEREDVLRRYLRASPGIPNEGEIYDLAMKIVGRVADPVAQAKNLFEWVSENAAYLDGVAGGGTGDVGQQLKTGRFGGASVDIAALFVSLCRGLGIPARLVFGLRIHRSLLSDSLSANPEDLRQAQHCRAEFYVPGYSWIPVDPADCCRANEAGLQGRELNNLRRILFGTWENNWLVYGTATHFNVPGVDYVLPFINQPLFSTLQGAELVSPGNGDRSSVLLYRVSSQPLLSQVSSLR